MKTESDLIRINLLVAVTTGLALALLTTAAMANAPATIGPMRYPVLAGAVTVIYLLLDRMMRKRWDRPPLVRADSPQTVLLAGLLPLVMFLCAAGAVLFPRHDLGLAVIIGGVWFGLTVESALGARATGAVR